MEATPTYQISVKSGEAEVHSSASKPILGFTASCFDLGPHAGHVLMLKEARENCDHLIVALQVDPTLDRPHKMKPIQSISERLIQLQSCRYVDEVIVYHTESELLQVIKMMNPDVRFLGDDYRDKDFTGKDLGIPIYYCARKHNLSSSLLKEKVYKVVSEYKQQNRT